MSFKMTYEQVSSNQFIQSVQRLAGAPFNPQVAFKIKKLVDELNRNRALIHDAYKADIQDVYGLKDAEGKIVMADQGQGFEIIPEKMEAFQVAQEGFGKREFTVNRDKLFLQELGNFQMSAADMSTLEPIMTFPQEATDAEPKLKSV